MKSERWDKIKRVLKGLFATGSIIYVIISLMGNIVDYMGSRIEYEGSIVSSESNISDPRMVLPRQLYFKADEWSTLKEYNGKKIDVEKNAIYDAVQNANLPNSYVGALLIEVKGETDANEVKIELAKYEDPFYAETGYADQNMIIDYDKLTPEPTTFYKKVLSEDTGIIAIPFRITEPILIDERTIPQTFNEAKNIICELRLPDYMTYESSARKQLSDRLQEIYPPELRVEILPDMQYPNIKVTSSPAEEEILEDVIDFIE